MVRNWIKSLTGEAKPMADSHYFEKRKPEWFVGDTIKAFGQIGKVVGFGEKNDEETILVEFECFDGLNEATIKQEFLFDGRQEAWHKYASAKLFKRVKRTMTKIIYPAIAKRDGKYCWDYQFYESQEQFDAKGRKTYESIKLCTEIPIEIEVEI